MTVWLVRGLVTRRQQARCGGPPVSTARCHHVPRSLPVIATAATPEPLSRSPAAASALEGRAPSGAAGRAPSTK